jgi:hypothetical protein
VPAVREGKTERSGQLRALGPRSEQPYRGHVAPARGGDDRAVEPDPDDLRAKRISLTTAGVDTVDHLDKGTARLLTALSTATPTQLTTSEKLLRRVLDQ